MSDMSQRFPMDFVGAAQSESSVLHITSGEEDDMDCRSVGSV